MENKNGFMMVILATMALGMAYGVESSTCGSKIEEACGNMTLKCCKTLRDLYENEYDCLCTYIKENNITVEVVVKYVTVCDIPAETDNPCPGYLNFTSNQSEITKSLSGSGAPKNVIVGIISGITSFVCSYLFTIL